LIREKVAAFAAHVRARAPVCDLGGVLCVHNHLGLDAKPSFTLIAQPPQRKARVHVHVLIHVPLS
jgi:hypothetical protein